MNKVSSILFILLACLIFPIAASSQDVPSVIYHGIWDTDRGTLALWQADDAVWGVYGPYGELGGHLDEDGRLSFNWTEDPEDYGRGWFTLKDSGRKIEGTWYSVKEMDHHGTWDGEFMDTNLYEIGDRSSLDHEPGMIPPSDDDEPAGDDVAGESVDEPSDTTDESIDDVDEPDLSDIPVEELWAGTWDTGRGELLISIIEGNCVGDFGDNGRFTGALEGREISAIWSVADAGVITDTGQVIFWLGDDGESFRGTYNKEDDPDLWLAWSGWKIAPPEVEEEVPEVVEEPEPEPEEDEELTGRNR